MSGVNNPAGSDPLVSAVIPTHDRPSYLRRAVRSVVDQTYDNVEMVVVDDNPETSARQALREVSFDGVTDVEFVRGRDHQNVAAARNTGIEVASGKFVAFLDDDDWWFEENLERKTTVFDRADDDVGLVYSSYQMVYPEKNRTVTVPPVRDEDVTRALLRRNVVGSMSVVVVRTALAAETPFDERFPNWEDLAWYIDLSQRCSFERISEPLVAYEHESPERLSEDLERVRRSSKLFRKKYQSIAARYGPVFEQKMRAWNAFRRGTTAFYCGDYGTARRSLLTAIANYPLESKFYLYLVPSLGGRWGHRVGRAVKRIAGGF